jgi:hypothetical protein
LFGKHFTCTMMRGFLVVSVFFLLYVSYYGAIHAAPLSSHHLQDSSLLYKWQQSESLPTYKRQTVNATAAPTPTVSAGETDIQIGFTGSAVRMAQKFGMLPSKERTVITVAQEDAADALILENASPYNVIQVEYVGSPSPFAVAFDVIVPDNEASSYLSQVKTNTSFQDDLRTSLNLPTSYSFHATQIASATPTPTVCYTLAAYGQYVPCTATPSPYYPTYSSSSYSSSMYPQIPTYPFIPSF